MGVWAHFFQGAEHFCPNIDFPVLLICERAKLASKHFERFAVKMQTFYIWARNYQNIRAFGHIAARICGGGCPNIGICKILRAAA